MESFLFGTTADRLFDNREHESYVAGEDNESKPAELEDVSLFVEDKVGFGEATEEALPAEDSKAAAWVNFRFVSSKFNFGYRYKCR